MRRPSSASMRTRPPISTCSREAPRGDRACGVSSADELGPSSCSKKPSWYLLSLSQMHWKGALSSGYACAVLSFAAILMMAAAHPEARSHPYDVKSSGLTGGDKKPAPQPAVVAPPTILGTVSSLRVQNIRLGPGPAAPPPPSSTLKFEMLNTAPAV
jgi:hypothetical protein